MSKILITLVVITAVGAAAFFVAQAVRHDRLKQQLYDEAPALFKDDLKLINSQGRS
ncbi:hypothetical protein [Prosthecobacter algae]|uniref:hypothetical protein n=1 Tax=Prosthecobacter algae TaxID=1144682 RepID=UPI0031F0E2C2